MQSKTSTYKHKNSVMIKICKLQEPISFSLLCTYVNIISYACFLTCCTKAFNQIACSPMHNIVLVTGIADVDLPLLLNTENYLE